MDVNNMDAIITRLRYLEEENAKLKSLLFQHGISYEAKAVQAFKYDVKVKRQLSLQEKVELFQSLFKGREDVFAKRWYSDISKKSGYQPVCVREWNREFCDKRKYKCSDCPNRQFAPLSYEYI